MGMILKQTVMIAGAGIGLGVLLGVAATAVLRSKFFGVGLVEWTVRIFAGIHMWNGLLCPAVTGPWAECTCTRAGKKTSKAAAPFGIGVTSIRVT